MPNVFSNPNESSELFLVIIYLIELPVEDWLEEYEEEALPIHVVHPEGRNASAKVRAFVDFAAERLRSNSYLN